MLDFYDSQPLSCLLRECYIWFSTRAGRASVTSLIQALKTYQLDPVKPQNMVCSLGIQKNR